MRVIVFHGMYGCNTGCCGHYVKIDDEELGSSWRFSHPYGKDAKVWATEFARRAVEEKFGVGHAFDLDWDNCMVVDD